MMQCGGSRKGNTDDCWSGRSSNASLKVTRDYIAEIAVESIRDELQPLQDENRKLWAAISDLTARADFVQPNVKGGEEQIAQLDKDVLQKRVERVEEHMILLIDQVKKMDQEVAGYVKQLHDLQQQVDSGTELVQDLRRRHDSRPEDSKKGVAVELLQTTPRTPMYDDAAMSNLTRECASLKTQMNEMEARIVEQIGAKLNPTKGEAEVVQKSPREDPLKAATDGAAEEEEQALAVANKDDSRSRQEDSKGNVFFAGFATARRAIGESIWEAAIFIGIKDVPLASSTNAILVLVVNVFIQGCFCIIIAENFTEDSLPEMEHVEYWRANAHQVENADPITGVSLVSRVCAQDDSLQVATVQGVIVENAQDYLTGMAVLNIETGLILFALAWLLWALIILTDIAAAIRLMHAILDLPRAGETKFHYEQHSLTFEAVHSSRVIFFGVVTLSRLAVSVALFWCGSLWLAHEINVENLILNASALGLIMDLDELLFSTVMPRSIERLVHRVEPLRVKMKETGIPGLKDVGMQPLVFLPLIAGFLIVLYVEYIDTNVDTLFELDKILCGGDQNFVWFQDGLRNIVMTRSSPKYLDDRSDFEFDQQLRIKAAIQRWHDMNPEANADPLSWEVGYEEFNRFRYMDMRDFTYDPSLGLPDCDSHAFYHEIKQPTFMVDGMLALAGVTNKSARGCKDLIHACGNSNAGIIRALCPSQCGCDSPLRGLVLSGPANGCPRDRCVKTFHYGVQLSRYDCSDLTVEYLSNVGWAAYWEQFVKLDEENGNVFWRDGMNAPQMKELALKHGCKALATKSLVMTFCAVSDAASGLVTFCPMTCGCRRDPDLVGCPHACPSYVNNYRAALDSLPCTDMKPGEYVTEHDSWAFWANLRFERWISAEVALANVGLNHTFKEMLDIVGGSGCNESAIEKKFNLHGSDYTARRIFCMSTVGPLQLFSLCPEMCGCKQSPNEYCPESCAEGALAPNRTN